MRRDHVDRRPSARAMTRHSRHLHRPGTGIRSQERRGSARLMTDFSIRSDNVAVEQIMRQIRARIREKRGVDYTEEEIRELANVKLEKFLDPRGVRSDLLEQFRRAQPMHPSPEPGNYAFGEQTLYES